MTKLNKVTLDVVVENVVKTDNRVNNTGRPVNKKSNRQVRLAKQAHYNNVNTLFVTGNQFKIGSETYKYKAGDKNGLGCIVSNIMGYVCNVDYIGRTKVKCYSFVLGKQVKITLNLKTLQFVK
mgnify:CR=1 FL=1